MFAYCGNNPSNYKDETGYLAVATLCLIGAVVGAAVDYATQVAMNYKNGTKGSAAWTKGIDVGSIIGSAFSGAVSSIPGGGAVASFVDSVGSVVIEHSVNSLLSGTQINFGEAGKEIATNLMTDKLIPDFAEVEIPKYIRDIKDEAVEKGIKEHGNYKNILITNRFREFSLILVLKDHLIHIALTGGQSNGCIPI